MVETFLNTSGLTYSVLSGFTNDISGSWFLTYLLLVLFIVLVSVALRIPIEFTAIFVLPLLLVLMAFNGDVAGIGGVLLIYLGVLLAKNFFFGR